MSLTADDDLWLDNDLAHAEFQADLDVVGTLGRPIVIGTVEAVDEGRMTFQGINYRLVGGAAAFTIEHPNDPELNGQAETRVGDYEVELALTGRLSAPRFELTSEPELPKEQIVAMLLTGGAIGADRGDITSGYAGREQSSRLADDYLLGRVGPMSPLRRVASLDVVQIDPVILGGSGGHTARLTLGEQISEKLFAAYSTFLGGTQEATAEVRYQIHRFVQLRHARESDGHDVTEGRYVRSFATGQGLALPEAPASDLVVGRVVVEGTAAEVDAEAIRKTLALESGKGVALRELRRASHRARLLLGEHGHPLARVRCKAPEVPPGGVADVTCTLQPGPLVTLEIEGDEGRRARAARQTAWEDWTELAHADELLPEAVSSVGDHYRSRGHAHVEVAAAVTESPEEVAVKVTVKPGPRVQVRRVEVEGNVALEEDRIRRSLGSASRGLFSRPKLTPRLLAADRASLEGLYHGKGFLAARVAEPVVTYPRSPDEAVLVFTVEEGPRSTIAGVSFAGNTIFDEARLRSKLADAAEGFASPPRLDQFSRQLQADYDRKGHPDASVRWRATPVEGGPALRVAFEVEEGPPVKVGALQLTGNRLTRPKVVRRALDLPPGRPYSRAKLIESQRRLTRLGVFRTVLVKGQSAAAPTVRDVLVRVREKDDLEVSGGLGYDYDQGPRLTFSVSDRNVRGRAASLGLHLRVGGRDTLREVLAGFRNVAGTRADLLATVAARDEDHRSFRVKRKAAALQLSRELGERTTVQVRFETEDIVLRDVRVPPAEVGIEEGRLAGVGASVVRDTRDNPFEPRRGHLSSVDLSFDLAALGSDAEFSRLFAQHSRYVPLGDRLTYGGSLRLGAARPFGRTTRVPLSERFFAGGVTSLRGYGRDELGPIDPPSGEPLGGEALLVLNQELRFAVTRRLSALAFVDVGNVFPLASDLGSGDFRVTAGPGLGISTPAGPIRFYYGRKLNDETDPGGGRFHFTFGATF